MFDSHSETDVYQYSRSEYKGFPTALVGYVGTCKNNRRVKQRNNTAYGWSTEIPGDMHAKGHLCEATFKAHGKGGFKKVVNGIMERHKLTDEAFKKKKVSRVKSKPYSGSSLGCKLCIWFCSSPRVHKITRISI